MPKIQFDVSVADGVAIDVANDIQIYFKNTPSVLTSYTLKLSSTKQYRANASLSMGLSTRKYFCVRSVTNLITNSVWRL